MAHIQAWRAERAATASALVAAPASLCLCLRSHASRRTTRTTGSSRPCDRRPARDRVGDPRCCSRWGCNSGPERKPAYEAIVGAGRQPSLLSGISDRQLPVDGAVRMPRTQSPRRSPGGWLRCDPGRDRSMPAEERRWGTGLPSSRRRTEVSSPPPRRLVLVPGRSQLEVQSGLRNRRVSDTLRAIVDEAVGIAQERELDLLF